MVMNERYMITETEQDQKTSNSESIRDKVYTYDEAIDLAGDGVYSWTLLATLSLASLSMAVDIFGFSVVVTGASCEFNLGIKETGILLSVTFFGPILMSYPWGYISDTQGRRKSLVIALWTSFLVSSASAFSPNWITLAVLKLISASFSSCAQSVTYTLLGESTTRHRRDFYILTTTCVLDLSLAVYVVLAYIFLNMEYSYNLGLVTFIPWRLLSLVLSMITGLGAVGVLFLYESPRFLLNQEKHDEAIKVLNGPILMSYPWGYISDTQGGRKSLVIALWTSFLVSSASAFSPNWITLAVLKLISASFSSCAQSVTYTLLGESTTRHRRDFYILTTTCVLDLSLAVYVVLAYIFLNMEYSYNLGLVTFIPWRLLSLVLSMITGLGAVGVLFLYESPRFLLNQEKHDEAIKVLNGIWYRNGGTIQFPVKNVILNETGNKRVKVSSIWRSLWEQLVPIFKPPLLWRSMQLYFLTVVVYGTNNSFYIWLPYLGEQFLKNINSNVTRDRTDLCSLLVLIDDTRKHINQENYNSGMDISLVWFSVAQGMSFVLLIILVSRIAHRKRSLMFTILSISSLSGIGAVLIENEVIGFVMLVGLLFNELAIGVIYSYFVELYPTSYRGTANCLATVASRVSALIGVSLVGALLESHCAGVFYICSGLLLFGVIVAFWLPKDNDRPKA